MDPQTADLTSALTAAFFAFFCAPFRKLAPDLSLFFINLQHTALTLQLLQPIIQVFHFIILKRFEPSILMLGFQLFQNYKVVVIIDGKIYWRCLLDAPLVLETGIRVCEHVVARQGWGRCDRGPLSSSCTIAHIWGFVSASTEGSITWMTMLCSATSFIAISCGLFAGLEHC